MLWPGQDGPGQPAPVTCLRAGPLDWCGAMTFTLSISEARNREHRQPPGFWFCLEQGWPGRLAGYSQEVRWDRHGGWTNSPGIRGDGEPAHAQRRRERARAPLAPGLKHTQGCGEWVVGNTGVDPKELDPRAHQGAQQSLPICWEVRPCEWQSWTTEPGSSDKFCLNLTEPMRTTLVLIRNNCVILAGQCGSVVEPRNQEVRV